MTLFQPLGLISIKNCWGNKLAFFNFPLKGKVAGYSQSIYLAHEMYKFYECLLCRSEGLNQR